MEPRTDQPAQKSVLVVDEDPNSLRILEVSLRNEGFDVQVAADATAAAAWLAQNVPGLVIAATAMAGVDGFELCRRLKEQPALAAVPFMLMGDPSAANKIRGIELGAEEFVSKPVYVKDIVGRVSLLFRRQARQRMADGAGGGDRAIAGDLADISVVDLIQTLAANHRSGVIHLASPQSGRADMYFRQGAIIDAEVGRLSGREAMLRLFSWGQGTYQIELKSIRRKDAIGLPPAALVMEGMRRLDEWQRLLKDLPSLQTVFEVDYRLLAERLAEIPDEVNGLLRLFDGTRTLLNVIDDCGLADSEALTLAGKLFGEGIIRDVQAPPETVVAEEPSAEGWLSEAAGPFRPPGADDGPDDAAVEDGTDNGTELGGDIHRRPTGPLEPLEARSAVDVLTNDGPPDDTEFADPQASPPGAEVEATLVVPAVEPPEAPPFPAETPEGGLSTAAADAPPDVEGPVDAAPAAVGEPAADAAVDQTLEALAMLENEAPASENAPIAHSDQSTVAGAEASDAPQGVATGDAIPGPREDESAAVIPVSDSPSGVRRTLVAAGGIALMRPDLLQAPEPPVGDARATEPGIGPAAEGELAMGGPTAEVAIVATPIASQAPVAAAGEIAAAPFSASASKWMDQGEDVSSSEALEELGLPSRHRGLLILIGGALSLAGLFFGARQWRAAHPEAATEAPLAATKASEPASPPPAAPTVEKAAAGHESAAVEHAPAATPSAAEHAAVGAQTAVPTPESPPTAATAAPTAPAATAAPTAPAATAPPVPEAAPTKAASKPPDKAVAAGGRSAAEAEPTKVAAEFPALLDKCRAAFAQGKMREAAAACAVAKDANGESGESLLLLAHAEFNRNHLKEALQWAEKAIKADPNMADAYVIFGGVQQDAGHNREAKWAYKKYLELAPRGQYATDLRAIVDTL